MVAEADRAHAHKEKVPPPRPSAERRAQGWSFGTLTGSNKGFGILTNPIYAGYIVWNRTQKVRNPEAGMRVMRARPRE